MTQEYQVFMTPTFEKFALETSARYRVPVYLGYSQPLLKSWKYADYVHGKDGMGENYFPKAGQSPEDKHAVHALLELVNSSSGVDQDPQ